MAQIWFDKATIQNRYAPTYLLTFRYTDGRGGREIGVFAEWAAGGGGMASYWADGKPENMKWQKTESRWEAEEWLKEAHEAADPVANSTAYIPPTLEFMDDIEQNGR